MPLKIMVVYEDKSIVGLMVEALASMGMEVFSVGDRLEAAKLTAQEEFDGIFVDPMMPIVVGCELPRRIHQSPGNRSTPIFILMVQHDNYATAQSFEATGTFFLQEPIDRDSLIHLLDGTRGIPPENRRRKTRNPLQTEVTRRTLSLEIKGISTDLSEDGILFQDDGSLGLGQKVQLTFSLPDQKPAMEVEGVVARVDARHRVLVCFTQITPEDRRRIKDFLAIKTG